MFGRNSCQLSLPYTAKHLKRCFWIFRIWDLVYLFFFFSPPDIVECSPSLGNIYSNSLLLSPCAVTRLSRYVNSLTFSTDRWFTVIGLTISAFHSNSLGFVCFVQTLVVQYCLLVSDFVFTRSYLFNHLETA